MTIPHGRSTKYSNDGCRCPACTEAHRIYHNEYMQARPEQQMKNRQRKLLRALERGEVSLLQLTRCQLCGQWLRHSGVNGHNLKVHGIELPHGTPGRAHHCGCEECRRWKREAKAKQRHRTRLRANLTPYA